MEKKGMLEALLKESDYVSRKQEKEILYGYLPVEETFFRRGWQRYLATSPENPSSQIPYRNSRTQIRKRKISSEITKIYQILYGQNIFSNGRKIENADEQMETFRSISISCRKESWLATITKLQR
jgi:hypothetical protein